ncbi:MAG: hypothetical protein WD873_02375 [Candidatus Hydrogenedentales bacterium]
MTISHTEQQRPGINGCARIIARQTLAQHGVAGLCRPWWHFFRPTGVPGVVLRVDKSERLHAKLHVIADTDANLAETGLHITSAVRRALADEASVELAWISIAFVGINRRWKA